MYYVCSKNKGTDQLHSAANLCLCFHILNKGGFLNLPEQELSEVIDEVTRDAEDDKSTLNKDTVFAKLNFTLDSGSFRILGTHTEPQTGKLSCCLT